MSEQSLVTAAILVIGDEILSGRTKDKNIGYMAEYMTAVGIDLREVRVVPDIEDEIVTAAKALAGRYTYLFTTGGIGPTHDDITADCIAKAAGVGIDIDPRAVALLRERFPNPEDLNDIIVMAGVPSIMQAMFENVLPRLKTGAKLQSQSIDSGGRPEGAYATALGQVQKQFSDVIIGSYPSFDGKRFQNQIVVRARDPQVLAAAAEAVQAMLDTLPPA